jgi:hypothetical protein
MARQVGDTPSSNIPKAEIDSEVTERTGEESDDSARRRSGDPELYRHRHRYFAQVTVQGGVDPFLDLTCERSGARQS